MYGSVKRKVNLINSQDNATSLVVHHSFFPLLLPYANLFHHAHKIAPKSKLCTITMQLIYSAFLEENNSCKTENWVLICCFSEFI